MRLYTDIDPFCCEVLPPHPRDRTMTDAHLMAAIAAGDSRAMAELVRRFGAAVLRHTRGRLGVDDAEDVAQDVWLRVWRDAGRFDAAKGSLGNWVMRFANNATIDAMRKGYRRLRPWKGEALAAEQGAVDGAAERDERRDLAWECAEAEPLLFLSARGGWDGLAVAEGLPRGTFATRSVRALKRAREVCA